MVRNDKNAKNSVAERIYGGFTASKIRRLIRLSMIFRRIFGRQVFVFGGEFRDRRRLMGIGDDNNVYSPHTTEKQTT